MIRVWHRDWWRERRPLPDLRRAVMRRLPRPVDRSRLVPVADCVWLRRREDVACLRS